MCVLLLQFDDKRIVSGSVDRTLRGMSTMRIAYRSVHMWSEMIGDAAVWDPDLGTCTATLFGHSDYVTCLQLFDFGVAVRAVALHSLCSSVLVVTSGRCRAGAAIGR
jgi:hypothetical protein